MNRAVHRAAARPPGRPADAVARHFAYRAQGPRAFMLAFARPAAPEPPAQPYVYDPARQLNVLADGRPAAEDRAVLLSTGTTTSTAGSKTHFDD